VLDSRHVEIGLKVSHEFTYLFAAATIANCIKPTMKCPVERHGHQRAGDCQVAFAGKPGKNKTGRGSIASIASSGSASGRQHITARIQSMTSEKQASANRRNAAETLKPLQHYVRPERQSRDRFVLFPDGAATAPASRGIQYAHC
jgi:hypothetical protein